MLGNRGFSLEVVQDCISCSTFVGENMLFEAEKGELLHHGQIVYVQDDYAFDFVPQQIANCIVLIDTIELDFIIYYNDIKRASQIWGFHAPPTLWIKKELHVPAFFTGSLILLNETIEEGDIIRLEGSDTWNTYYDAQTGWVCIGADNQDEEDVTVEFATNLLAVLQKKQLKAIWLKPLLQ
jgi:hypothetical protein